MYAAIFYDGYLAVEAAYNYQNPENWDDYIGVAFHAGVFVPAWADNSNNLMGNRNLDIYTARDGPKRDIGKHAQLPELVLAAAFFAWCSHAEPV
ncbi:MAG: hypothetical protein HYX68_28085 [Planctomycetes bacterium]|nr:hypothetical protein [Planctomycetota bacterium]